MILMVSTYNDVVIYKETSTIQLPSNGYIRGSREYHNLDLSAGDAVIYGSNTFNDITFAAGGEYTFDSDATTTITGSFGAVGSEGSLVRIVKSSTNAHTFSKKDGVVVCDYITILKIVATGGAIWYAGDNSVNEGGSRVGMVFREGFIYRGIRLEEVKRVYIYQDTFLHIRKRVYILRVTIIVILSEEYI